MFVSVSWDPAMPESVRDATPRPCGRQARTMKHKEAILLTYRGEPVRTFALADRPLEIGRDPRCDIVVHDEGVADRALLVQATGGTVMAYELGRAGRGRPRVMPRHEPLALGAGHAVVRVDAPMIEVVERTERMLSFRESAVFVLLVGLGEGARRLRITSHPVVVGASEDADLVLADRAVSARHCRLDPVPGGIRLRDLGSRNGTWVDGVRIDNAELRAGAVLRVGRTDLRLVLAAGRDGSGDVGMVAESASMLRVLSEVERLAKLPWPVFVQGETGVGKEGVAQAIHRASPRARGPWVALNAGGLSPQLVESELFGHEKGAFTGAASQHRGVFEQAHGGTLFLDEVGELPLDLQARLLRVLETFEVRRVGAERAVRVDVKLVCATHRDLRAMVSSGRFREDLYYRIRRFPIEVPPLRDRTDDIAPLAARFLADAAGDVGVRSLDADVLPRLLGHGWPGNVRELRNVVTYAAATCAGEVVLASDIDRALTIVSGEARMPAPSASVDAVIAHHRGNLSAAARSLGISRTTLRDRMRRAQRITKDA